MPAIQATGPVFTLQKWDPLPPRHYVITKDFFNLLILEDLCLDLT